MINTITWLTQLRGSHINSRIYLQGKNNCLFHPFLNISFISSPCLLHLPHIALYCFFLFVCFILHLFLPSCQHLHIGGMTRCNIPSICLQCYWDSVYSLFFSFLNLTASINPLYLLVYISHIFFIYNLGFLFKRCLQSVQLASWTRANFATVYAKYIINWL